MKRWLLIGALGLVVLIGLAITVAQSPWFADQVAKRIQQEVQRATGARVTIGKLTIDWRRMHAQTGPLVIYGLEPPDAPPLFACRNLDVGLKIISFLRRNVDVESVLIEEPRVNLIIGPDGSTNIPGQGGGDRHFADHLIDLAVGHFEVRDGLVVVNDRKTPLDIRAEGLRAIVDYIAASESYQGKIAIGRTTAAGVAAAIETQLVLKRGRLDVQSFAVKTERSTAEGSGYLEDWRGPRGTFDVKLFVELAEAARLAKLPELRGGSLEGPIRLSYSSDAGIRAEGELAAKNVSAIVSGERLTNVSGSTKVSWDGTTARADDLKVSLWGGRFSGRAEWHSDQRYLVDGQIVNIAAPRSVSTYATGPIQVSGRGATLQVAQADLTLRPGTGQVPLGGKVGLTYDAPRNSLILKPSTITIRNSQLEVSGDLSRSVSFDLQTRDLQELVPAIRLAKADFPETLPVQLEGGLLHVRGTATGSLENPTVNATLAAEKARYENRLFTDVQAAGELASNRAHLAQVRLNYGAAVVSGAADVALSDWQLLDTAPLTANANFQNVQLAQLAKEAAYQGNISGVASGSVKLTGSIANPNAEGSARIEKPVVDKWTLDRAEGNFSWRNGILSLTGGQLARNGERLSFAGSYKPEGKDWQRGELAVDARTAKIQLDPALAMNLPVTVSGNVNGRARIRPEGFDILGLDGNIHAVSEKAGSVDLRAASAAGDLVITGTANLYGATAQLDTKWRFAPGLPGSGKITLKNVTTPTIQSLMGKPSEDLPFNALVEGTADIEGQLTRLDQLSTRVVVTTARIGPKKDPGVAGLSVADLTLRNDGDVIFAAGTRGMVLERARFVAKDTEIQGTGNISLRRANVLNMLLKGRVNLAVFSTFRPDLVSSGVATTSLRVRGSLNDPQLEGRMELTGASFYLRNVPTGLDKVNGAVIFDSTRASIESLTAETGGGTVRLAGFIGFGENLSYQLQAQTERVRLRYPEGISTQTSAQLTLTGTSRRSLLSGNITILRASIGETSTAATLFTNTSASPLDTNEVSNDFLRGLQFDVKIDTAQSAEFSTQLTKDVQADASLTIRGTPARPIVLGRISVTQGAVQFFGTDYNITRGEISFLNPVRIDPQIDLDLETRVRGIVVSINFSGPMDKLNMSYRSDPPLQSSEIIGLLALGRTPTTGTQVGTTGLRTSDLFGGAGGNAILSSAMSAPSSGALQRFFGITRVKIDPQLIGLDNTPQARLSFEQQISRDVSVTYVTSLNRAQYQLVRVQWDLSRQWSAIATRDENGVLSVDFLFKKSFK